MNLHPDLWYIKLMAKLWFKGNAYERGMHWLFCDCEDTDCKPA